MKQLLLILLVMTCVLFPAPAGSNGPNEEPTELPSIEPWSGPDGHIVSEPNEKTTEQPPKSPGLENGHDKKKPECPKNPRCPTSQTETMSSANFYGPTANLNANLNAILKTILKTILNAIFNVILIDILRGFDNLYKEISLSLLLAVLAVSLAFTTHQAILGFLQMPKLVLLISTCLIVFAGMIIWSYDVENKWMVLLEILIPVVFISGMLVYCYRYLLIGLFVLVVSVILQIVLGVANEETYDIGIAEFCGIGGGAWLAYKNRGQLSLSWKNFCNQFSRRKSGKDEKERENRKNEG